MHHAYVTLSFVSLSYLLTCSRQAVDNLGLCGYFVLDLLFGDRTLL